jgi:hypothetical protein
VVFHAIFSNSVDSNQHQNLRFVCSAIQHDHMIPLTQLSALHPIWNYSVRSHHDTGLSCSGIFSVPKRCVRQRVSRSLSSSNRWPTLPSRVFAVVPNYPRLQRCSAHSVAQRYHVCGIFGYRALEVCIISR